MGNAMKILVTGGAGFVGTNLVKRLKELGNEVVVIDNHSAGKTRNHISNVLYLNTHTKNIRSTLEAANFTPEIIYHLGEYSKIAPSFKQITTVFDYNIKGSFEVLEYVRHHNIPLVYAASSTKLAAEGENHSPYSFFKSLIVQLIRNYAAWYGIKYSICYFYNAYGEYQDTWENEWKTVVGVFEEQWKNKQPLTVVGDGSQRRDFTYVGDIVNGLIMASNKIENDEYQLGTGNDYSILEVAQMFGDNIVFTPPRPGDRRSGLADARATQEKLGWVPTMSLDKWIEKVKLQNQ
jgi:UDP-glucose 4-epimerase